MLNHILVDYNIENIPICQTIFFIIHLNTARYKSVKVKLILDNKTAEYASAVVIYMVQYLLGFVCKSSSIYIYGESYNTSNTSL